MTINLKKKNGGMNLIKEILSKKITREQEIEQLSKLKNPITKKPDEKDPDQKT